MVARYNDLISSIVVPVYITKIRLRRVRTKNIGDFNAGRRWKHAYKEGHKYTGMNEGLAN
jgi:hypothetical protein